MIIISVLGVLAIMTLLNLNLSSDTMFNAQYLAHVQNSEAAYYLGVASVKNYIELFKLEKDLDKNKIEGTDSLSDLWNKPIPPIKMGEFTIVISIEDLDRYFALNSIIDENGNQNEAQLKLFKRLLKLQNLNEDYANAVADWLDKDDLVTIPMSSETPAFKNIKEVKNGSMDSLGELAYIKGFAETPDSGESNRLKSILPYICVQNSGKVNINTASTTLLQALDDRIDEKSAQEIVALRQEAPFKKLDELAERITGFNSAIPAQIQNYADVKSQYFKIKAELTKGEERYQVTAIVKRGDTVTPISWSME